MDKTYHFMAGLPRTGSTVLSAILNQNPFVYVTPTSPMLNVISGMQHVWREDEAVKANYFPEQIDNLTRAIVPGFWKHRSEKIIIDRNRNWNKNMLNASKLFGSKIKIIETVRDLPSIMASWLNLIKQQKNNVFEKRIIELGHKVNDSNIMAMVWFDIVKDCMEGLKQVKAEASEKIIFIDYDDLINDAKYELEKIEDFLDLPKWKYNFNLIENDVQDDDLLAWGFDGLHTIRPKLEKISKNPKDVLGENLYNHFVKLEKEYNI